MELSEALRLIVITDQELAAPRSVEEVVEVALRAGARAVSAADRKENRFICRAIF